MESLLRNVVKRAALYGLDDFLAGTAISIGILHRIQNFLELGGIQPFKGCHYALPSRLAIDDARRLQAAFLAIANIDGLFPEAGHFDQATRRIPDDAVNMGNAGQIT